MTGFQGSCDGRAKFLVCVYDRAGAPADFIQPDFCSQSQKSRSCGVHFANEDTEAHRDQVVFLQKLESVQVPGAVDALLRLGIPLNVPGPSEGALCWSLPTVTSIAAPVSSSSNPSLLIYSFSPPTAPTLSLRG